MGGLEQSEILVMKTHRIRCNLTPLSLSLSLCILVFIREILNLKSHENKNSVGQKTLT